MRSRSVSLVLQFALTFMEKNSFYRTYIFETLEANFVNHKYLLTKLCPQLNRLSSSVSPCLTSAEEQRNNNFWSGYKSHFVEIKYIYPHTPSKHTYEKVGEPTNSLYLIIVVSYLYTEMDL